MLRKNIFHVILVIHAPEGCPHLIRSRGADVTKKELLRRVTVQARSNGFNLQAWFQSKISREWPGPEAAIDVLAAGHRYYALLFSHDFATHFWKQGEQIQFVVPTSQFSRVNSRGETITVTRKAFTRRTLKPHAWEYHLREMATFEEPLRYIRRYLMTPAGAQHPEKAGKNAGGAAIPPRAESPRASDRTSRVRRA